MQRNISAIFQNNSELIKLFVLKPEPFSTDLIQRVGKQLLKLFVNLFFKLTKV
jgi:hypothetical protein